VISLPDLVEAPVRLGRAEDAAIRAEEFERRVTDVPDLRVPALVARCHALVSTGPHAGMAYREALVQHQGDPDSFVVARTQLLYGEWLRRQGQRRSARAELDAALEVFEKYGAAPGRSEPAPSCEPAEPCFGRGRRPGCSLPKPNCGSRCSRPMGSPTARSAASSTSARKRSSFISAACTAS
jgi:hypothetical protein